MLDNVVVLMAGEGRRFKRAGFALPKPMILVENKPMFLQAAKSLSLQNKFLFVFRSDQIEKVKLKEAVAGDIKNFELFDVGSLSEGQATSCFYASKKISKNQSVLFLSCDFGFSVDETELQQKLKVSDIVILVRRPNTSDLERSEAYGWMSTRADATIKNITCKKVATLTPQYDFIITGGFAFSKNRIFNDLYFDMVQKEMRVNGEYYMDLVPKLALSKGYSVTYIVIKDFKNWGTPADLKNYEFSNC